MKINRAPKLWLATLAASIWLQTSPAYGITNVLFFAGQTTNLIASGTTSDTIGTEGYSFNLTRDKLFTGGVGLTNPIGRYLRVQWPDGLEAQGITTGPNPGGAKIVLKRIDGAKFALKTFTAKLLGNTAGAGAAIEVMPLLDGEDGFPDPLMCQASGYYGQNFTYETPQLTGFDAYKITLYVDFALMNLTLVDPSPPVPTLDLVQVDTDTLQLSWTTNSTGYVLQSSTNLHVTTWNPVANDIANDGELFSVLVDMIGTNRFYRLMK